MNLPYRLFSSCCCRSATQATRPTGFWQSRMATESLDDTTRKGEYSLRRSGRPLTTTYRVYFERTKDRVPVSPFHDIPLYHDKHAGVFNMVVEIPRWSNAKFEVRSLIHPTATWTALIEGRTTTDPDKREPQPHQPGHAAQETALHQELLPVQGLHMELWRSSPGESHGPT